MRQARTTLILISLLAGFSVGVYADSNGTGPNPGQYLPKNEKGNGKCAPGVDKDKLFSKEQAKPLFADSLDELSKLVTEKQVSNYTLVAVELSELMYDDNNVPENWVDAIVETFSGYVILADVREILDRVFLGEISKAEGIALLIKELHQARIDELESKNKNNESDSTFPRESR